MATIMQNTKDPTKVMGRRIGAFFLDVFIYSSVSTMIALGLGAEWQTVTDVYDPETGLTTTYYDNEYRARYGEPRFDVYVIEREELDVPDSAVAAWSLLGLLYLVGNYILLQGYRGYTVGKLITGLRCVGWDGRPPGPLKTLLRSVLLPIDIGFFLVGVLLMFVSKTHKRVGDVVAGTFVIESPFEGRVIIVGAERVSVGGASVRADEVDGIDPQEFYAARRPTQPVFDKRLKTYVVWNEKLGGLMWLDQSSNTWNRFDTPPPAADPLGDPGPGSPPPF